jgi:ParB/RepB/Spo0J family partition protein
MEVSDITIKSILPPPTLRTEGVDVSELVESIRQHGLLQPIIVRPMGSSAYQVIAGNRRLLACRELGWKTISAIVVNESSRGAVVKSIVENLQRENLTPLELARGIRELSAGYQINLEEISRLISKSSAQVRLWVRLARLPDDVLNHLESGEDDTHKVSGLAPRHIAPFVSDLPSEEDMEHDSEAAVRYQERVAEIRELQDELERRGTRINAHMADEIGRQVRKGQMTVTEAIDRVLSEPERYRFKAPIVSAEELEADTFAAYKQIHSNLDALVYKLRPEIAVGFSQQKKAFLLQRLEGLINVLEKYRRVLSGGDSPRQRSLPEPKVKQIN